MRMLRFLLQKEFLQIVRDHVMLRLIIAVPVVQLVILSNAATFEVKESRMYLVDDDRSELSRGLVTRLTSSGRFVEVQGTAEGMAFTRGELDDLLALAEAGIKEIAALQAEYVAMPLPPR